MPNQDLLTLTPKGSTARLFLGGELPVLQPGNSQALCPVLSHMLVRMAFLKKSPATTKAVTCHL